MIDRQHELPLTRQSQILELSRSSLYYRAIAVSERDLQMMRIIDEVHLKYPFYGSRNIRDELRDKGYNVGRGHASTLMKKMGIEALYRKPRLSKPHPGHKTYPYLLRGVEIVRANQPISPICQWQRGTAILWPSWIGPAGEYWHGGCPTHLMSPSVLRH